MRWRALLSPFRFRLKLGILCVALIMILLVSTSTTGRVLYRILQERHQTQQVGRLQTRMVAPRKGDYFLEDPLNSDFSRGQSKIIDDMLQQKENGFFVDIGAGNGETNSVTLFFERERKWTGILVEASEAKHRFSIGKNRQCHLWNFRIRFDNEVNPAPEGSIKTQQLFAMINRTTIDLLSINLHGFELDLIQNIDFVKYHIRVVTIEMQSDISKDKYQEVKDILTAQGYDVAHHVIDSFQGKKDVICVRKELLL